MRLTKIAVLAGLFLGVFGISLANAFSDLPSSHWAYDKVNEMQEKGIISGYTDGTFRPQNEVTREEFATILSKALDLTKKSADINFRDVSSDRWSKKYIDAVSLYLTGYEANGEYYFKPGEPSVREDVAIASVKAKKLDNEVPDYTILDRFSDKDMISENAKKYVAIAVKNGIMNGNADDTFNPKGSLNRAEITALICNMLSDIDASQNLLKYPMNINEFNDATIRYTKEMLDTDYLKEYNEMELKNMFGIENDLSINEIVKDTDEDGIWDILEKTELNGFDSSKKDSNEDGFCDAAHFYLNNMNFIELKGDLDDDGLTNEEEILIYGTKSDLEDSDFDGITDMEEIKRGLNPLKIDSDRDGVSDLDEIKLKLNPLLKDSDGDGIEDDEEEVSIIVEENEDYNNLTFKLEVVAKIKDREKISIEAPSTVLLNEVAEMLSCAKNISMGSHEGTIKVDVSNIADKTPTLYYFNEDEQFFHEVNGQHIEGNVLYASIETSGNYIIINKSKWDKIWEDAPTLSEKEIEFLKSFSFLYTEVGSDWNVMYDENKKILNYTKHSMIDFNSDILSGYKLYNAYGLKLELNTNRAYIILAQNSLSNEVDFSNIQICYSTDGGRNFKPAQYEIVNDRGRDVVHITINESGLYGVFYK